MEGNERRNRNKVIIREHKKLTVRIVWQKVIVSTATSTFSTRTENIMVTSFYGA